MDTLHVVLGLIILIFSVILHEIAHGYMADAWGDPTARHEGRLTLNPLPHIDVFGSLLIPLLLLMSHSSLLFGWARPVPYNPYNLRNRRVSEPLVALAGSLTNISLALLFGLIVRFGTFLPGGALSLAATITFTNLFLGLFNLLPFPPLDGFSALRAGLPWHLVRYEDFTRQLGFLPLFFLLFFFSFILTDPFFSLVETLFSLLTGVH